MKLSPATRQMLAHRRIVRALEAEGFMRIGENASPIRRLARGDWIDRTIAEARVGPDRRSIFIRLDPEPTRG